MSSSQKYFVDYESWIGHISTNPHELGYRSALALAPRWLDVTEKIWCNKKSASTRTWKCQGYTNLCLGNYQWLPVDIPLMSGLKIHTHIQLSFYFNCKYIQYVSLFGWHPNRFQQHTSALFCKQSNSIIWKYFSCLGETKPYLRKSFPRKIMYLNPLSHMCVDMLGETVGGDRSLR